jgi:5-methyltetrahydrofolate--homocysteine methyltransferase
MSELFQNDEQRSKLIHMVADLMEREAIDLAQQRIQSGGDPLLIVQDCQEGLRQVGERYERREYYLSGLIMAGEIFREIMDLLAPLIEQRFSGSETGVILLGTVEGDIHDIGKNNLSLLLSSYGFTVHDLGVDIPPAEFVRQAELVHPDIIGLSGLLTSSYDSMRATVAQLRASSDRYVVTQPVVIGGNQLNEQVCRYVGADAWVTDAMTGVRLCQALLARSQKPGVAPPNSG